ncbi:hypothetical protein [Burkholderia anthina]|uniref:hypothetical protein n=1 Tax=Burkholderia anthina TaxID=179879 RepID=UPI001AA037AA|nr:hypothetical protein [Burkholderia anthina]QTD92335.1 hypothetical protein J4G50_29340 [Burkholderia anthina]
MKSDFIESELELYVQRLLVHEFYSSGNAYKMLKISPGKEKYLGYDAEIVGLTSFYCQFKTSDFLTKGTLYDQRNKFCATKGWPLAPFYSFALRAPNDPADKEDPTVWQHNILHAMWKKNPTGVAYVAPIFHTRLEMELHEPSLSRGGCVLPYNPSSIAIEVACIGGHEWCRLPAFEGLVSIPPHTQVKVLKHNYCFTDHSDITFHSDPEPVDSGNTLHEQLTAFIRRSTAPDNQANETARMSLPEVRNLLGFDEDRADFLERFLAFGLLRAGVERQQLQQGAARFFDHKAEWLEQRLALAAALKAFFGISTLGLFRFAND